jgi:hypothetical protein
MILYPNGPAPNVQAMIDREFKEELQKCFGTIEAKPQVVQTQKAKPVQCTGTLRSSTKIAALPK